VRLRTFLALAALVGGPVHLATYIPACPKTPSTTVDFMPVISKNVKPRDTQAHVDVYRRHETPPPGYEPLGQISVHAGTRNATYLSLLALALPQANLHGGEALVEMDSTMVDGRPMLSAEVVRYSH
jgi:hypothetical protein